MEDIKIIKEDELVNINGGTFGYDIGLTVGKIAKFQHNLTVTLMDPLGILFNRL